MSDQPLSDWAKEQVYEYDLDMSTTCEHCCNNLNEGQLIWKDIEVRNSYYCSRKCVLEADAVPRF